RSPFHEAARDLQLVHGRPAFNAVRRNEMNRVAVTPHGAALRGNIVGHNPVAAFCLALPFGEFHDVLRLGSEANDERRTGGPTRSNRLQDVRVLDELKRGSSGGFVLLDLLFGGVGDPPVSNGSSKDAN